MDWLYFEMFNFTVVFFSIKSCGMSLHCQETLWGPLWFFCVLHSGELKTWILNKRKILTRIFCSSPNRQNRWRSPYEMALVGVGNPAHGYRHYDKQKYIRPSKNADLFSHVRLWLQKSCRLARSANCCNMSLPEIDLVHSLFDAWNFHSKFPLLD